jgi:predicted alpha-1,2-mannosidase
VKISVALRIFVGIVLLLGAGKLFAATIDPASFVDPMIGTDAHGHTYPGATVPFGMVQLSPDTRTDTWDGCSGYHFDDTTIIGFSHTHLSGTGCGDLGDIMLMPTVGDVRLDAGQPGDGYVSRFSHSREEAQPGYYKVYLSDPGVTAELTATTRTGFQRYTFPATNAAHIVIDLDHGISSSTQDTGLTVENSTTLSGYRQSSGWGGSRTVYFVMEFSRPFESYGIQKDGQRLAEPTTSASGGTVKAFVSYTTKAGEAILVKVGISPTSIDEARKNLVAENPGWDFDAVKQAATKLWNKDLGVAEVSSSDPHILRTFYSNLYLAFLAPTIFNNVDGSYLGMDHQVHTAGDFQNYTTFSIWDIYRAEAPLLNIVQPQRINDIVNTLLAQYQQLGQHTTAIWPLWDNETWCMTGYHSVDIIAAAYLNGFRGFDAETAYRAMRDTAMQNRNGLAGYKTAGYVPSRPGAQATSKTLEYSFDDWCIARMAQALGHEDDAKMFYARAANYNNVFDKTSGFFRGRKADGTWRAPFDTIGLVGDEYTEADAWQYAFIVQQDLPGLINLYGGDGPFIKKLDDMFAASSTIHTDIPDISGRIGQYSQGDEQSHHVAYLYDYAGAPYKTQKWIRDVMREEYTDKPDGECGNTDCGQMTAWYVFSAMGFYPVNPDSGVYMIGSPVLDKAVLHLDQDKYHGHTFTVIAANNSPSNVYIQSAEWNGKPYNKAWITYQQISGGGTLRLVMGPNPNKSWASSPSSLPPATMPADFHYPTPPTPFVNRVVQLPVPIHVACGSEDPIGDFVPDPNMIDGSTSSANVPIDTSAPNAGPVGIYQSERWGTDFTFKYPVPTDKTYTVRLHFAELFDPDPGMRIENIWLNSTQVLTNFEILKAAGSMNKALVETFTGIKPNAKGDIDIRVAATPNSPDQNAKISGIEIVPEATSVSTSSVN